MKRKLKYLFLEIVSRFVATFSLVWAYAGIIMGIISPMLMMVPLYYLSWNFFEFFIDDALVELWIGLDIRSHVVPGIVTLLVFEFIIFLFGLIIFIWGLSFIVKTIYKKEGLAIGGPYKIIRHPQHVGIILMSLVISLYLPWTTDAGIRSGEILSWSLFSFILILWSHLEDWFLKKKFEEEYIDYRSKTRAFIPRFLGKNKLWSFYSKQKYWIRLLLLIIVYIGFVALLWLILTVLYNQGIFGQVY